MLEGTQIGGYRVLRQIGEGGMGAVWMAEHAMLGRRAAIKILHASYSTRQDIVTRFFNEARAATAISDPGIIQIFDFGFHTDGSAYIVMELLDGEPLDRRLQRLGTLSVGDALRICRQVASAVGAAHACGITHRDLKPENIFMVRDPEVMGGERAKVLDFGIAKLAGELRVQQQTCDSAVMGTPLYMSPEQCRGAGRVDQRADVYSLGCVLFALVTGHAPFTAEGVGEIIMQHMLEPPPRPSTRSIGVPPEVDDLILRCLAKSPTDRFASGTALAAAIDELMGRPSIVNVALLSSKVVARPPGVTTLGSSAAAVESPPTAASSNRGKLYAGVAALAVAAVAAFAVVPSRSSSKLGELITAPAASDPAPETAEPPPPRMPAPLPREDPWLARAKADMSALLIAFSKWAVDHAGAPCPMSSEIGGSPSDPWGHLYQLTCTDQPADQVVGVVSMGPDGVAGTSDDLTSWTLGREVTEQARGTRWIVTPVAAQPAPAATKKPRLGSAPPRPMAPAQPTPKPPPAVNPQPSNPKAVDEDGIPEYRLSDTPKEPS